MQGGAVPDWNAIRAVQATGPVQQDGAARAVLPTDHGALVITIHDGAVRLRFGDRSARPYFMLVEEPAAQDLTVSGDSNRSVIAAGDLELTLEHAPLSFELRRSGMLVQRSCSDGHFTRRFRLPPFARVQEGWLVALDLQSGERVYGLGEKWGRLDRRGQWLRSFNHDALGVNAERSYKNAPFAWSPSGWAAFVHTPAPVAHAVGFAPWSQRGYALVVEDGVLDLFLLAGSNGADLLARYTQLTGRAPEPPLWSLGVILSKAYYKTADELLAVAREVRARRMPCDVITLDGRAWQDTDTRFAFEWDATRYPDPRAPIDALKRLDFRICVWEYPLISVRNPLFDVYAAKGWLLTDRKSGAPYRYRWEQEAFGPVLTPLPDSGLVDFTHPDAYADWRDRHRELFELGIDMIKADFGEQVDDAICASNGETGHALHNVYALLYNRCVYEAAERYCASGPFLFSRAAWIGAQRYPSQWGGDPQADWEGFAASLRGGLSWGMTGAPYYATDVGGFYGDRRDDALYVRWTQASVFSAHMRLHGIGAREPWSYGAAAEHAAMQALRLRYRLLPYLAATVAQSHSTGLPVQRAMPLAVPDDRAAWAFEDQFFCGDDLLVAPCTRPDGRVEFYLPEGDWRRFPSGETFAGGRVHRLTLALDEFAAFARAGATIPLGPDVEHTAALGGCVQIQERWRAA